MNWFGKSTAVIEVPETDADRLKIVEESWQEAQREYLAAVGAVELYRQTHRVPPQFLVRDNKMLIPVGGPRGPVELQRLESVERHTLRIRNERMRERAILRMKLGLVR
jgi:hypothetical protein